MMTESFNVGVNYPFKELKLMTKMFEQYFVDFVFKFNHSITRKPDRVKTFPNVSNVVKIHIISYFREIYVLYQIIKCFYYFG